MNTLTKKRAENNYIYWLYILIKQCLFFLFFFFVVQWLLDQLWYDCILCMDWKRWQLKWGMVAFVRASKILCTFKSHKNGSWNLVYLLGSFVCTILDMCLYSTWISMNSEYAHSFMAITSCSPCYVGLLCIPYLILDRKHTSQFKLIG